MHLSDRRVFLEWKNTHMHQIIAYKNTKEYGTKDELLILQYNLDGKVHKKCQYICQGGDNTLCSYFPTEYTYYLDPPDSGAGNKMKS